MDSSTCVPISFKSVSRHCSFDGCGSTYVHKYRSLDGSVNGLEFCTFCISISGYDLIHIFITFLFSFTGCSGILVHMFSFSDPLILKHHCFFSSIMPMFFHTVPLIISVSAFFFNKYFTIIFSFFKDYLFFLHCHIPINVI